MGNCRSMTDDEIRNEEINKQLRKDAKIAKELVKLLLLGKRLLNVLLRYPLTYVSRTW